MRTVLVFLITLGVFGVAQGADPIEIRASIWPYKSLCEFKDPPNSVPSAFRYDMYSASELISPCVDQNHELGHPTAVRLVVKNLLQNEAVLTVKGVGSITVTDRAKKTSRALAMRQAVSGLAGMHAAFVKAFEGGYGLVLGAGQEVDVVVLFSNAAVGDSVRLDGYKPSTIK
jgi:hypothetical protein